MDKNLKILAAAIAVIAIVCIVAIIALYAWRLYVFSTLGSGGSLGSLLLSYSQENGSQLNQTQYAPDGSFSGRLYVEGTADTMLIALVDYNVTAFGYNGSTNKTHIIPIKAYVNNTGYVTPYDPSTPKEYFNVSGMPDGFHDVQFLGFVDPYNFSDTGWVSDGPFSANGVRFNVIVNNSSKPELKYTDGPSSNDTFYSGTYEFPSSPPSLSKEPLSIKGWQKEKVKAGDTIDYYVNLAHPTFDDKHTNYSFAILQLLDYDQIPIRIGSADNVYYGHIDNGTFASVHMSLKAPAGAGNHKLIVIVSGDPYSDLEVAPYVENNMIFTTNRNVTEFTNIEHQDIIVS